MRESDYVLLICTPAFAARADDRVGVVGYEQAVVTGEIFSGTAHPEKFIPVLRGDPVTSVPSFLRSRLWVDFRDDKVFDQAFAELLSTICPEGSARHTGLHAILDSKILTDHEDLLVYEKTFDFARSKTGLAKTHAEAEEFSEGCRDLWSLAAFRNFAEIFKFAWSTMKLSRSSSRADCGEQIEDMDSHQRRELGPRENPRGSLSLGLCPLGARQASQVPVEHWHDLVADRPDLLRRRDPRTDVLRRGR